MMVPMTHRSPTRRPRTTTSAPSSATRSKTTQRARACPSPRWSAGWPRGWRMSRRRQKRRRCRWRRDSILNETIPAIFLAPMLRVGVRSQYALRAGGVVVPTLRADLRLTKRHATGTTAHSVAMDGRPSPCARRRSASAREDQALLREFNGDKLVQHAILILLAEESRPRGHPMFGPIQ